MQQLYYIHSPDDWQIADSVAIKAEMERLHFQASKDAAVGEGAGGAGFETVVEVVLSGVAINLLASAIYDIAKYLWAKRPTEKKLPEGLPEKLDAYRLVVHVEAGELNTIIGVDLRSDLKDIETAVTINLENKLKDKPTRAYQNGDNWDTY